MDIHELKSFHLERVLDQDSHSKSIILLGTLPAPSSGSDRHPAVVTIQKTPFDASSASQIAQLLDRVDIIEHNDIYYWFFGWLSGHADTTLADVRISIISPATEVHIRKYTAQKSFMISETPQIYKEVTEKYISAFPPSRVQWVYNILNHVTESDHILFEDPSPSTGYILLPDAKWDRKTLSSLYLVAIAHSSEIKSLRDLRKAHIPMLKSIKSEATKVVNDKWGLEPGRLRMYIHYQPSYYQFHVHVVTTEFIGLAGMNIGQAHLLEDVISLLELDPDERTSIFQRMTLTYGLGEKHGLFEGMKAAGAINPD